MDEKILSILSNLFDLLGYMDLDLDETLRMFICGVTSLSLTKAEVKQGDYPEEEARVIANDFYDEILKTTMRYINKLKEQKCT